MNSSESDTCLRTAAQSVSDSQLTHNSLFVGDTGEISVETRRALVQLLTGPSLDGRRHSKLWTILLRDEKVLRSRLSELFLELVIDRDLEVAFTRQADTHDLEAPVLLRRAQLTFLDSVLLLYLRQRLIEADAQGERAVVSIDEINEHMMLYRPAANTDHAGFMKRLNASIEKIKKFNILQKLRASDDRLEVSPTLKLLFSTEQIQVLIQLYKKMSSERSAPQLQEIDPDEEMAL